DSPNFPEAYKAEATAGAAFLDVLRAIQDLDWTFFSPAATFVSGERTGTFRLGTDQLIANDEGSSISYEDYALALADEIETPKHVKARFTIG
ncbi:NAD(P)-dependent oxidoreductase, partial [Acinetobacter baumannii]